MDVFAAALASVEDLDPIIRLVDGTSEDAWQLGRVRSTDQVRNCFFGHLHAHALEHAPAGAGPEEWAGAVWEAFEERWATTYRVYPVNDGENPRYPEPTARARVRAFLEGLRDGRELTTHELMDVDASRA